MNKWKRQFSRVSSESDAWECGASHVDATLPVFTYTTVWKIDNCIVFEVQFEFNKTGV